MKFRGKPRLSKYGGKILLYPVGCKPGKCFKFTIKNKGKKNDVYFCQGCQNQSKSNKRLTIKVKNDMFLSDPETMKHPCNPSHLFDTIELLVQQNER